MALPILKGLVANYGKLGYQVWHRPLKNGIACLRKGNRRRCLLRRKMTKLRNSYPEGIACVLLFSSRLSNDGRICTWSVCLCCQLLEWKLHVDLTVKQVYLGSTYFNCCTVLLVDWKGLLYSGSLQSETFRVTSVSAFYRRLFELSSYKDEFNKRGIGEVQ